MIIVAVSTGVLNESHAQKLTPEQKAAFCNPNNPRLKFVNSTESAICGIPKTPSNTTTSPSNTTTSPPLTSTTQPPSTTLTPSAP
jgi:hypothetical protein